MPELEEAMAFRTDAKNRFLTAEALRNDNP
jgi:hypothetical protein